MELQHNEIDSTTGVLVAADDVETYVPLGNPPTHVKISSEELAVIKRAAEPGLRLVGFQPASTIHVGHRLKHAWLLYPAERLVGSAAAYAALAEAMREANQVGIVRQAGGDRTSGLRMHALVPSDSGRDDIKEGLYLVPLPFADEIRKTVNANPGSEPPSASQVAAARDVVRSLKIKSFNPENFDSPKMQHYYSVLEALALSLEAPAKVEDLVVPNKDRFEKKKPVIEAWKGLFEFTAPAPKKRSAPTAASPAKKAAAAVGN